MKSLLVVAPIAITSPICSTIVAVATGATIITVLVLNLAIVKLGTTNQSAAITPLKSTWPVTIENTYPPISPTRTGRTFKKPFPYMLIAVTIAKLTIASIQFPLAMPIAVGASLRPITIIIGPVIIGGKKLIIFSVPKMLIT